MSMKKQVCKTHCACLPEICPYKQLRQISPKDTKHLNANNIYL